MPEITLPYFIYWSVACIFIGILLAARVISPMPIEENHSTHFNHDHVMKHDQIEVDSNNAPSIKIKVTKDIMAGWNLIVTTENFTFTPQNVNHKNISKEGHAHIYIDGIKLTRLYARHYHLSNLLPGEREITVSLNANDHSEYVINGKPIAAKIKINQTR